MAGAGELVLDASGNVELAETTGEVHVATNDPQTCCCNPVSDCYVKPKSCVTGVDHPLFVVPCSDHYYVFEIAGPGDCWYVDTDFTTYDAVPDGYADIGAPLVEYDDCDDCYSVIPPEECAICHNDGTTLYANGDTMIVTVSHGGYDVGIDPVSCVGPATHTLVLTYNSGTNQFEGTGPNGSDVAWHYEAAGPSACSPGRDNECRWSGSVDSPVAGASAYYARGLSIYSANSALEASCQGYCQSHNCHATPPGWDNCDYETKISVSIFPTGTGCYDPDTASWTTGAADGLGCCI